eukprot:2392175-Prymnesium_polylepis.1
MPATRGRGGAAAGRGRRGHAAAGQEGRRERGGRRQQRPGRPQGTGHGVAVSECHGVAGCRLRRARVHPSSRY